MAALSARERRLIGAAVIGVLVTVGWLFAVEPIRARHRDMADLVPARERVLAKRWDLIFRGPTLDKERAETAQRVEQAKQRLLAATAPPVAASELVKIVKDAAAAAHLEVRSERILPPAAQGELLEIPVEITVSGGIRELVAFLYQLEDVRKLLVLRDLKIRVVNLSQPKDLLAVLTLAGFVLPKPSTAQPS